MVSKFKPSTGTDTYCDTLNYTVMTGTSARFVFQITMNKSAQDSNGAQDWLWRTNVTDQTGGIGLDQRNFAVGFYQELTFVGSATGSTTLTWSGAPGANASCVFWTYTTSNDAYALNISYTGTFAAAGGAAWGVPDFWIREEGNTSYAVPQDPWYQTSVVAPSYQQNVTHELHLLIPELVTKDMLYEGVIVYVQATNL